MIVISQHALDRGKERLGLNETAVRKLCAMAYCYGKQIKDTEGVLKTYLQNKQKEYPTNDVRVYGQNLYIFCQHRLVTIYQLPNNVKPKSKKHDKIRNNQR